MNRFLRVAALCVISLITGPTLASVETFEEARLVVPGDGSIATEFGTATALDGNTLVVGRWEFSAGAPGSAQVFVRSGTTWTLQATLVAEDLSRGFGVSVAVSGNTAVVGAREAAYVFIRNGTTWTQQAKLVPAGNPAYRDFGAAVAVSGDNCLVGAPKDTVGFNEFQGSTYVFIRSGSAWTSSQRLSAADGMAGDEFGSSVAVHNGSAVIGVPLADVDGHSGQGAAYVFVLSSEAWVQQHKLTAADGAPDDRFGSSVGLFANSLSATAAVGARNHDTGAARNEGAAYVFERKPITNGVVWDPAGKLTANSQSYSRFGDTLSVSGRFDAITGKIIDRVIAVGASGQTVGDTTTGTAYVFVPSGVGTWAQQGFLTASDGSGGDRFGAAVAASGATVVAGAPGDDVDGVEDEGSAYVFTRSGTTWSAQAHLSVFSGATGDQLGYSVAISGNTALVGAPFDSMGGDYRRGSAYVFVHGAGGWTQQAQLLAADGVVADSFGRAVALSGDIAVVGAPSEDLANGKAYVFVRDGSAWTQQALLGPAGDEDDDVEFGAAVAISGETIVVGASQLGTGAAYVFVRDGVQWSQQQRLVDSDGAPGDRLGFSVAISGNTVVAGAPTDTVGTNSGQGSVSVFVRSGGVWTQQVKLFAADDGDHEDHFGAAVSISGRRLLVGAPRDGSPPIVLHGSAYVFERTGNDWTQLRRLEASTPTERDLFGTSVALTGNLALVGAPSDTGQPGAAYLFTRSASSSVSSRLIASDFAPYGHFGASVALSEHLILNGAPLNNHGSETWAGAVYVDRMSTDFGDAPNTTFPTRISKNGAGHLIDGPRLGATIDGEVDGQPNSGATGDDITENDDEDGVVFGTVAGGTTGNVFVSLGNAADGALLDGWIDFNRDGDWNDAGERVFKHRGVVNGNQVLGFPIPAGLPAGTAIARMRLSTDGVASPTGLAVDGEVEDVQVTLQKGVLPTLSIDNVRSTEGDDGNKAFKFTVTLSARSVSPVTVTATTADGTAIAPGDYKTRGIALSISPGQTRVQFSIPVVGDTQVEPGETLNVVLTDPTGATLADAKGVGTIVNDD